VIILSLSNFEFETLERTTGKKR